MNKSLSRSPQNYAYKAYFEALLGYGATAKKTFLKPSGWLMNRAEEKAFLTGTEDGERGKLIHLTGVLHLDLALQNRLILGGTPLSLKLIANEPDFFLTFTNDNIKATVEIEACSLMVSIQETSNLLLDAQNKALRMAPAKYPISRMEIHADSLNAGTLDYMVDNLITGQLPRRLFVTFVKNTAYNGAKTVYPYDFENLDVNFMALYIDGVQHPLIPFQPNFEKKTYSREYLELYKALNQNCANPKLQLTYDEFGKNNTIFTFMLSPDITSGCGSSHVSPIKYGSIRLHTKFAKKVPYGINVLCFAEYDNIIELDASRMVSAPF
ncbi:hypothetical protein HDE_10359 [Halotydeus destructor]|nr:hypothetical protein HDE_10359 [Halotydeus destructor]